MEDTDYVARELNLEGTFPCIAADTLPGERLPERLGQCKQWFNSLVGCAVQVPVLPRMRAPVGFNLRLRGSNDDRIGLLCFILMHVSSL